MKKCFLFFLLVTAASMGRAQKVYFIYIQTESPTPFFVKMGDKVASSTSQGYIILPSLRDSSYTFSIGMPQLAEKKFTVTINHKDRGFLLKDFSGTWGLFDLQSLEVINAEPEQKQPEPLAIRSDEFSKKLALAIDDPTLLFVYAKSKPVSEPVLVKKESNIDPVTPINNDVIQASNVAETNEERTNDSIIQTIASSEKPQTDTSLQTLLENRIPHYKIVQDTSAIAKNEPVKIDEDKPVLTEKPFERSKVTRRSESSTTEGFGLVFLDTQDGVTDTIRILIPNPPVVYKTEADLKSELEQGSGTKVLEKEVRTLPEIKDTLAMVPANPACIELATEADFKKLRRDMVSKDNEEDMVDRARRFFKTKCFTTAQVKLLGGLFLTPGGRYSFFDAAYGHVSDPSEFGSLRSELSNDEYYLKRFKALIGE